MRSRALALRWLFLGVFVLAPSTASAHFHIDHPGATTHPGPSPVPWWQQDALGSPQKLGPCGDEDDGAQSGGGPTNVVTAFAPGQKVTLQWTEIISHAGWFRIAIAADRAKFVDPPVLVGTNGNSADAGIESPPVLPVLADGIYRHPVGASKTWPAYDITLPDTPCAKCTIQIIQVMLDHPSNLANLPDGAPNPDGFLYHHCMDISIGADGGSAGDAGNTGGDGGTPGGPGTDSGAGIDAGADADAGRVGDGAVPSSSSGCGCTQGPAPSMAGGALSLLGLAILLRRRRSRSKTS